MVLCALKKLQKKQQNNTSRLRFIFFLNMDMWFNSLLSWVGSPRANHKTSLRHYCYASPLLPLGWCFTVSDKRKTHNYDSVIANKGKPRSRLRSASAPSVQSGREMTRLSRGREAVKKMPCWEWGGSAWRKGLLRLGQTKKLPSPLLENQCSKRTAQVTVPSARAADGNQRYPVSSVAMWHCLSLFVSQKKKQFWHS